MEIIAYTDCYSTVRSKTPYSVCQYEQYFTRRQNLGSFLGGEGRVYLWPKARGQGLAMIRREFYFAFSRTSFATYF